MISRRTASRGIRLTAKGQDEKAPEASEPILVDDDFTGCWYECAPSWPPAEKTAVLTDSGNAALEAMAKGVWQEARAVYLKKVEGTKSGKMKFRGMAAKAGTLDDRVAALTLIVQESPVHRLDELRELITLAPKTVRGGGRSGLDALTDLFVHDLLPPDRKLIPLSSRQSLKTASKRMMVYAYFESELKKLYTSFLGDLKILLSDNVSHNRMKCLRVVSKLLSEKPEQEAKLLELLVNKLGDPERKVASSTCFALKTLLEQHEAMKGVVATEVLQFLHRRSLSDRAKQYAMTFLSQLRFLRSDAQLATRLMDAYLAEFQVLLDRERGEALFEGSSEKLVAAILTGANRAIPFAASDNPSGYDMKFDSLFKVAHSPSLGASTQALTLLGRVSKDHVTLRDRFFRALYSRLSRGDVATSGKQALFLKLVAASLLSDSNHRRILAFLKRILQVGCKGTPSFAAGCLLTVSDVIFKLGSQKFRSAVTVPERDYSAHAGNADEKLDSEGHKGEYKIDHRDPAFADAHLSCFWELCALTCHYHPSVARFSEELLRLNRVTYDGDPLKDFGTTAFLDRISFKKPKRRIVEHLKSVEVDTGRPAANSEAFEELLQAGQLHDDEQFLGRFFGNRMTKRTTPKRKKQEDDDDEAEFDAAFEKEMRSFVDPALLGDADDDLDESEDLERALNDDMASSKADILPDEDTDENQSVEDEEISLLGDPPPPPISSSQKPKRKRPDDIPSFAPAEDYDHLFTT